MKPKILHIETSSKICSVSLSYGDKIITYRDIYEENSHSKYLALFVKEIFEQKKITAKDLDAIAVSIGPGSYTGLRIGLSFAKGIAYQADIPILTINTLQTICNNAKPSINENAEAIISVIDARRDEVFSQVFSSECKPMEKIKNEKLNTDSYGTLLKQYKNVYFVGNGASKVQEYIGIDKKYIISSAIAHSNNMLMPALEKFNKQEFSDIAYLEPFYMKPFIAIKPKNKVLGNLKKD